MKQGFKIIALSSTFEDEIEKLTNQFYIKKWQVLEGKSILGNSIILIEYRDKFPNDEGSQPHDSEMLK